MHVSRGEVLTHMYSAYLMCTAVGPVATSCHSISTSFGQSASRNLAAAQTRQSFVCGHSKPSLFRFGSRLQKFGKDLKQVKQLILSGRPNNSTLPIEYTTYLPSSWRL